jgi:hypothetical protein
MGSLLVARERVGYGLRSLAISTDSIRNTPTYASISKDR